MPFIPRPHHSLVEGVEKTPEGRAEDRCRSLIAIGPWFNGYDSPLAQTLFENFGTISVAAVSGGRDAALE